MAAGQLPYALMSAPVAADASQPNAVRHVPSSNSTLPRCIGAGKPARNSPSFAAARKRLHVDGHDARARLDQDIDRRVERRVPVAVELR